MLQAFRDNLKGTMAIFIVGLMIIPFALFGVDSLFLQDNSAGKAAEVNGVAISEMDLNRAVRVQKQQLLQRFGDQAPADLLSDEQLRGPVLTRLLQRELLRQSAENGHMAISEAELDQLIKNTPQFQQDSRFSPDLYLQLLRGMGYTPVTYKNLLTQDILVNQHVSGINSSAFATQSDINTLTALTQQTRSFYYLTLPYASASSDASVSETEIEDYYTANTDSFKTTEQISLDYIELNLDAIAENTDVDPAEVRAQYEQEVQAFEAATQRQVAHILVEFGEDAEEKLAKIQQRLAAGDEFSELARELSEDLGSSELGGDLGMTDGNTFPEAFETAAAQLEVGSISEPVETDAGYHIIKLLAVEESAPPSFEDAQQRIAESLARASAEAVFVELLEELPEATYNAADLNEAADQLGLTAVTSDPFDRNGGPGLLSNNQVLAAAFGSEVLEEGVASDLIELSDNHVVVIKLNTHQPSAVKPITEVNGEIRDLLVREKTTAKLEEQATALISELETGKSVQSLAEANSLEWQVAADVKRGAPGVDQQLIEHVFSLSKPTADEPVYSTEVLSSGDVVVAQLTVVKPGSLPDLDEAQLSSLKQRLAQELAGGELAVYQSELNGLADIEIY